MYHWEVVLNTILDQIAAGKLGGEAFVISLSNGGLEMEFNDSYALDADIQASGVATIAGLSDGSITVPAGE